MKADVNDTLRNEGVDAVRERHDRARKYQPAHQVAAYRGNDLYEIDVTLWHGKAVPEREWTVHNRIIRRNVALLSGPGGVGKSILITQLGIAHVLGRDWIGTMPVPGAVLYLNAEDDQQEIHRRLDAVLAYYGAGFDQLGDFHLVGLAGQDAVLAEVDRHGVIRPTPLFDLLYARACAIQPVLVALDTAADMFAGNENDRAQVRQFIGLLRGIAIDADCAVLLASHPSVSGMEKGTGLSGSTAWHNSVRTRLYFQSADKADDSKIDGLRELRCMKSNYGPDGEVIRLRFDNGVFKPVQAPTGPEQAVRHAVIEALFLQLLDRSASRRENLSASRTANNFAPTVFAKTAEAKAAGIGRSDFADALDRLLGINRIGVEQYGSASRNTSRIVRKETL
jgi:RecA-family ATPase